MVTRARLRSQSQRLHNAHRPALARQRAGPDQIHFLLRLAEIGGISAKAAREIYGQVEAATLGGWRTAATKAEVPPAMIEYWQKEMTRQTQPLRDDATVSAASAGRRKTKRGAFE